MSRALLMAALWAVLAVCGLQGLWTALVPQ